jgi:hypothetical protein
VIYNASQDTIWYGVSTRYILLTSNKNRKYYSNTKRQWKPPSKKEKGGKTSAGKWPGNRNGGHKININAVT